MSTAEELAALREQLLEQHYVAGDEHRFSPDMAERISNLLRRAMNIPGVERDTNTALEEACLLVLQLAKLSSDKNINWLTNAHGVRVMISFPDLETSLVMLAKRTRHSDILCAVFKFCVHTFDHGLEARLFKLVEWEMIQSWRVPSRPIMDVLTATYEFVAATELSRPPFDRARLVAAATTLARPMIVLLDKHRAEFDLCRLTMRLLRFILVNTISGFAHIRKDCARGVLRWLKQEFSSDIRQLDAPLAIDAFYVMRESWRALLAEGVIDFIYLWWCTHCGRHAARIGLAEHVPEIVLCLASFMGDTYHAYRYSKVERSLETLCEQGGITLALELVVCCEEIPQQPPPMETIYLALHRLRLFLETLFLTEHDALRAQRLIGWVFDEAVYLPFEQVRVR